MYWCLGQARLWFGLSAEYLQGWLAFNPHREVLRGESVNPIMILIGGALWWCLGWTRSSG